MAEIALDARIELCIVAAQRLALLQRQAGKTSLERHALADALGELPRPALEVQPPRVVNETDKNPVDAAYERHCLVSDSLHQNDRIGSPPDGFF